MLVLICEQERGQIKTTKGGEGRGISKMDQMCSNLTLTNYRTASVCGG